MIVSIQKTLSGSDGLEIVASQILRRGSRKDVSLDREQQALSDGLFQVSLLFCHCMFISTKVKFVKTVALRGRSYVGGILVCIPIAIPGYRPRGPTDAGLRRRIFNDCRLQDRRRICLVRSICLEFVGRLLPFFNFIL